MATTQPPGDQTWSAAYSKLMKQDYKWQLITCVNETPWWTNQKSLIRVKSLVGNWELFDIAVMKLGDWVQEGRLQV